MLKKDPNEELFGVLRHIATEFDSYKTAVQRGNFTSVHFKLFAPENDFNAPKFAVRLNGFLFVSLTMALSTALIGMMTLQWIREFERNPRLGPVDAAVLQYVRLEGINFWGVPEIISLLPILLQTALAIFFWALCDLLWELNQYIASLTMVYIGIIFSCFLFTNVLPSIQFLWKCCQVPFKSPSARLIAVLAIWYAGMVIQFLLFFRPTSYFLDDKAQSIRTLSESLDGKSEQWLALEAWLLAKKKKDNNGEDKLRLIVWVAKTHISKRKAVGTIYGALEDLEIPERMSVLCGLFAEDESNPCVGRFIHSWQQIEEELGPGEFVNNLLKDVIRSLVLYKVVVINPQLGPDLIEFRMELLVKIFGYKIQGNSTVGEDRPLDIWRIFRQETNIDHVLKLLSPLSKGEDGLPLSDGKTAYFLLE